MDRWRVQHGRIAMNPRELFNATMHYGERDRLFHWEMEPYDETLRRWRAQGLANNADWRGLAGYDPLEVADVKMGLCPAFARETLDEDAKYEVYRDTDGVIKKRLKDVPPPSMPQYIEYPLKGREQWPEFRKRLDPKHPDRLPHDREARKARYAERDFPLGASWFSIYGWLRNWMGVEGISLAVYDDPAFIEQAAEEIADCILGTMDVALGGVDYDFACVWEDMAYRTASLIDPALYRKIFLPRYARITERLRKAGIDVFMLDSDGNVEELIPCWLDIGINLILPMEAAAGMDVVALRGKFGKDLLMAGGMDKRILAGDKPGIKRMVEEKIPLMREGGYIPGIDHEIPPDIPWENFIYYRQLLDEIDV